MEDSDLTISNGINLNDSHRNNDNDGLLSKRTNNFFNMENDHSDLKFPLVKNIDEEHNTIGYDTSYQLQDQQLRMGMVVDSKSSKTSDNPQRKSSEENSDHYSSVERYSENIEFISTSNGPKHQHHHHHHMTDSIKDNRASNKIQPLHDGNSGISKLQVLTNQAAKSEQMAAILDKPDYIQQAQDLIKRQSQTQEPPKLYTSKTLTHENKGKEKINKQIKDVINKGIITPVNLKDVEDLSTPVDSLTPSVLRKNVSEQVNFESDKQFGDYLQVQNQYMEEKFQDKQRSKSLYSKPPEDNENPAKVPPKKNGIGKFKSFINNIKSLNRHKKEDSKKDDKDDDDDKIEDEEVYKDDLTDEEEEKIKKIIEDKRDVFIRSDFFTMDFSDNYFRGRKITRKHIQKNIIYPEQQWKGRWEILITFLLLLTCILTPYVIAFEQDNSSYSWSIFDGVISFCFLIDIIINFFSAFYDSEFNLIDDRKTIARTYFYSWFIVDIMSIIPFDVIFDSGSFNKLARVARIGKLYKIVRMTRMVRMLKIVKERNKLVKYLNEILKIGIGFERLLFLMMIFLVLCHIAACLWVFTARFEETSKNNWIYQNSFSDYEDTELYITAFYFTVTTIVTVGFGDIHAYNMGEKIICILLMLIGVIAFSFATGSLSSIISNYDQSQATLKEKFSVLNDIKREYQIGPDLFDQLRRTIKYDHSKNSRGIIEFMEELPYKLKIELAMEIHKNIYKTIEFFKYKERSFIAWVGPLLRPVKVVEQEYIYKEGDEIKEIYFAAQGVAGYVLPRFDNIVYIKIEQGDHFGHVDLVFDQEILQTQSSLKKTRERNKDLLRRFTIQAIINCELLILYLEDIDKMKIEFPDVFEELFTNSYRRLRKEMQIKIEAIKMCEAMQGMNNLRSSRATGLLEGMAQQSVRVQKYKEKVLKRTLTKGDVINVAKFTDNIHSLKQIDEVLEEQSCSSDEDKDVFELKQQEEIPQTAILATNEENPPELQVPKNEEEKNFMNRFKKNFGKILRRGSSAQVSVVEGEDVDNLKERVEKMETMFTQILMSVNQIKDELKDIKSSNHRNHN